MFCDVVRGIENIIGSQSWVDYKLHDTRLSFPSFPFILNSL